MASSYKANDTTASSTKQDVNTAFVFEEAQVWNDGSAELQVTFNDGDWITVKSGEHHTYQIEGDKFSYRRGGSSDVAVRYVLME